MIKVCFVCLGNICRSPMAEFIFQSMLENENLQDKVFACSKATSMEELGNPLHPGAAKELEKHGIPYVKRKATTLTKDDYDHFDYFIGMDASNVFHIKRIFGGDPEHKVFKLLNFADDDNDIADPWYTGDFSTTYQDLEIGCKKFLDFLKDNYQL